MIAVPVDIYATLSRPTADGDDELREVRQTVTVYLDDDAYTPHRAWEYTPDGGEWYDDGVYDQQAIEDAAWEAFIVPDGWQVDEIEYW